MGIEDWDQPDWSFSDGNFEEQLVLRQEQITHNKMYKKICHYKYSRSRKIANDIATVQQLLSELAPGEEMMLISNAFDSPAIISTLSEQIRELYIATWAITPAGISVVHDLPNIERCVIMLDRTHSYKWIFSSGAYSYVQGKATFKFAINHSKMLAMRLSEGSRYTYLNVIGSMNLSNNPRYENMLITTHKEDYEFIHNFIDNCEGTVLDGKI